MPTSQDPVHESEERSESALEQAAISALRAPSFLNTQPWRWRIHDSFADLRADRDRQLRIVDPKGRMLTMSCGIALHHLLTALAAAGHRSEVARLPDRNDPDLLARVRIVGDVHPEPVAMRHYQSILTRHTDRRPFTGAKVEWPVIEALRAAVEAHSAHLHVVRPDQLAQLVVAADRAAAAETGDPAYRAELASWMHRPAEARDGVPADTAVPDVPRRVPLRDLAIGGQATLAPGTGDDAGTTYAILFTSGDDPETWLRAGEAFSALLLTAVEHGASVSPMSDLVEVEGVRQTLRQMLSGLGQPLLALRVGVAEPDSPVPTTPRRDPADVIERETSHGSAGT